MIAIASFICGMVIVIMVCLIYWWIDEEIRLSLLSLLTGIYLIGWSFGEASIKAEILTYGETAINGNTYIIEEVINNEK